MTTKTAILIGGGITIIGVLGIIVFQKIKNSKSLEDTGGGNTGGGNSSGGNTGSGNTGSGNTGGGNTGYNTYNDRKILKDAIAYWKGTDEDAIDSLIARTTQAQRDKIRIDWDSNLSMYDGDTLKKWIEGDYSGSEEKRILKSFGY
jgi:hypothetical protein